MQKNAFIKRTGRFTDDFASFYSVDFFADMTTVGQDNRRIIR